MIFRAGNISARFLFALVLSVSILFGGTAQAQTAEGCEPSVEEMHQAKATVEVAKEVNSFEEHMDKPDSTNAVTCFQNLSGFAADSAGGGGIFSGDFRNTRPSGGGGGLSATISDSLETFYKAYVDSDGRDSAVVDYMNTALPANQPNCDEVSDLWDRIKTRGVRQNVPFATLSNVLSGTMPGGAGLNYSENWDTEDATDNQFGTFSNSVNQAVNVQKPKFMPTYMPDFDFCATLTAAGVPSTCP